MRFYSATVQDRQDPEELGRLRLVIPAMLGTEDAHPDWIRPRVPGGVGAGSCGLFFIPPEGALVIVEEDEAGGLRWQGAEVGAVNTLPDILTEHYPARAGFTSPEGEQGLVLDEDDGLVMEGTAARFEVSSTWEAIALSSASITAPAITLSSSGGVPEFLIKGQTWAAARATRDAAWGVFLAALAADATNPAIAAAAATMATAHTSWTSATAAMLTTTTKAS